MNFRTISSLSLVCLCLCSCQQAGLKRVRVAPEGVKVKVEVVDRSQSPSSRNYVGTVEVAKEAVISASHAGTLEKVYVRKGRKVRAGDPLFQINSTSVRSAYEAACATYAQAKDGYDRADRLFDNGSVSQVKMVELETRLSQARASRDAAEASLKECTLRAPFDGEISDIMVHEGERVVPAQSVLSMVDAAGLEIAISVPETEINGIGDRDLATVSVPALEKSFTARVKNRAVVGNTLSHSYRCVLDNSAAPKELMAGMVCKVAFQSEEESSLVIPADAVKMDDNGRYVWTVKEGRALKSRIVAGGFSGRGVVVREGLQSGDSLIVEGMSKVSSGMKVKAIQ